MGLTSEMKTLSEEIIASFKQRIIENEELVNDVQKTLDGFRKDHQEMAAVLNENAASLRKGLALGEKERLEAFNELMTDIHSNISSIQQEVVDIKTTTLELITEFTKDRTVMAKDLSKFFNANKAARKHDEKERIKEFDTLMKDISLDIKNINDEVLAIFKETNELLDTFEKEHKEMSAELRSELGKNLAERVVYTRTMLTGFQKRLAEISKENMKMAQKLRKDLDKGELDRLGDYTMLMKGIFSDIKGIQTDVKNIKKATSGMIGDYAKDRQGGVAAWNNMQASIAKIRKAGLSGTIAEPPKKVEKKEVKAEPVVEAVKEIPFEAPEIIKAIPEPVVVVAAEKPKTLEQKMLEYLNKHPKGARISEMEGPLGETRMKLGFTAKALLDEGKVQKIENLYYPVK
jgi:hypothetical protein